MVATVCKSQAVALPLSRRDGPPARPRLPLAGALRNDRQNARDWLLSPQTEAAVSGSGALVTFSLAPSLLPTPSTRSDHCQVPLRRSRLSLRFVTRVATLGSTYMANVAVPRKRTKTFTGCWTCRERKIKCDEAQPNCLQCRRKGLQCEGYGARLQWLPPVVACAPNQNFDIEGADLFPSTPFRRTLPTGMTMSSSIFAATAADHSLKSLCGLCFAPVRSTIS